MTGRIAAGTCALLLLCIGQRANAEAAGCQLVEVASLDITIDPSGGLTVPVSFAGSERQMLIDTGGVVSVMAPSAADALNLHRLTVSGAINTELRLYGNVKLNEYVLAEKVQVGRIVAPQLPFVILPENRLPKGVAGTIGADFLHNYDVEIDSAKRKLNLFQHAYCGLATVYWTGGAAAEIDLTITPNWAISFPTTLDGKDITADIDTGSSRSLLNLEYLSGVFGWAPGSPELSLVKAASDPEDPEMTTYSHPFHSLTFQNVSVANPDILIVPGQESGLHAYESRVVPPLIIGMGIVRHLHIYIAYGARKLYATSAAAN